MEKFLELVVKDLLGKGEDVWSKMLIVIPGKRPRLFLQHFFKQYASQTILLPEMVTIQEFMEQKTNLVAIEKVRALVLLFSIYKNFIKNADAERFWFFGEMILADFNDIDKYLLDAEKVFFYIKSLKEIDALFDEGDEDLEQKKALIASFWKSLGGHDTGGGNESLRKSFLKFWELLSPLYKSFSEELQKRGLAYEGMLYRKIAHLAQNDELNFNGRIPVFVGFNALSASEHKLFELAKRNNGMFYWDYDTFYAANTMQEAGHFIRYNLKKYPSTLSVELFQNLNSNKHVEVITAPGEIEMVQTAIQQLDFDNYSEKDPLRLGIVLANEKLLTPLLQSIPGDGHKLNVTMGLPFQSTSVYGLINHLLEVGDNVVADNGNVLYSTKWMMDLLRHPFIYTMEAEELIKKLLEGNSLYTSTTDCSGFRQSNFLFPTFAPESIQYIQSIVDFILNGKNSNSIDDISYEAFILFARNLNQLSQQLSESGIVLPDTLNVRLIRKMAQGLSLPLEGEPLEGIQVMGMIESRMLDFDHLVLVGANEGFLPSVSPVPSFIPYNIRKAFGLLTYEHQDAIFAYYFYRLIQRARKTTIIYNGNEGDDEYGEKSRFLEQISFDLKMDLPTTNIQHEYLAPVSYGIEIRKDESVMQALSQFLEPDATSKLYPANLNDYIDCPLRFYFRKIAKLKEPEKYEPGVDQRIFGLVFHDTMEELYKPFLNKGEIQPDWIRSILRDEVILKAIEDSMSKHFSNPKLQKRYNGQVLLVEQVVLRYVKQVLKNDIDRLPFSIKGLENDEYAKFPISRNRTVNLGGKFDRMEEKNGQIWVVDYKTGKQKSEKYNIATLMDNRVEKRSKEAFQAMAYGLIARKKMHDNCSVVPSLLFIQKNTPIEPLEFRDKMDWNDLYNHFEAGLTQLLEEIFNPEVPFSQTENKQLCQICQFKSICHQYQS